MKAPTAAQRRTWIKLAELGCIACYIEGHEGTPGQVHHIKKHGYHDHSLCLCLCDNHHNTPNQFVPCVHHQPTEFMLLYGTEYELLYLSLNLIGEIK